MPVNKEKMLGRPLHNIKEEARRLRDVGQAAVTVECAGQGEGHFWHLMQRH